jgi:hypothetical protein
MNRTQLAVNASTERVQLISAQAEARARLAGVLAETCTKAGSDWAAKLVLSVGAGIEFAARAPEEARLLLPDAVAIDPALGAGAEQTSDFLATLLRRGREHFPLAATMPELTERAMVGSVTSLIGVKLLNGEAALLPTLRQPLTQLLLTPYVGRERARELSLRQ